MNFCLFILKDCFVTNLHSHLVLFCHMNLTLVMSTGSTYCFTAVSVSVSVSILSHPKAPPAQFFLGAPKYDPSYVEIIFHW